jgi:hypothetical protein
VDHNAHRVGQENRFGQGQADITAEEIHEEPA